MGIVAKLIRGKDRDNSADRLCETGRRQIADSALDTLGSVIRTFGDLSFALDDGFDPELFRTQCFELASHIENGASVPSLGFTKGDRDERQWNQVHRFCLDRRQQEKDFVERRHDDYRDIVDHLLSALRQVEKRNTNTAQSVHRNLELIQSAMDRGQSSEIKATLNETIQNIADSFARQHRDCERHIGNLRQQMSCMRQDFALSPDTHARDELTGACNRDAFDRAVVYNLNLKFILDQPATLILIDLNKFKAINDRYGHAFGDEILRKIGDCLLRIFVRKTDIVARYGGDEFAIILADTVPDNAVPLVDRLLCLLQDLSASHADKDLRITCAAGITELIQGDDMQSLLKRAGEALGESRRSGHVHCLRGPL